MDITVHLEFYLQYNNISNFCKITQFWHTGIQITLLYFYMAVAFCCLSENSYNAKMICSCNLFSQIFKAVCKCAKWETVIWKKKLNKPSPLSLPGLLMKDGRKTHLRNGKGKDCENKSFNIFYIKTQVCVSIIRLMNL